MGSLEDVVVANMERSQIVNWIVAGSIRVIGVGKRPILATRLNLILRPCMLSLG